MSIKKYIADADTTITNAFKEDLVTRATGSNMGLSDSLEVFSIYGQTFDNSIPPVGELEKSRILIQFPVADIIADRTAGTIPTTGVKYVLNLYNAVHPNTLPKNFTVVVQALSEEWSEGHGLDMEEYKDEDAHNGGSGSGWKYRAASTTWGTEGGQVHATPVYTATFEDGDEDLSIDITTLVDEWIATPATKDNYGVLISMSGSFEDGTDQRSYYTKKFFARGSEFFFKRPALEARWDSAQTDDRGNFYASGSLMTVADNTHKLYLRNYVAGRPTDVKGDSTLRPRVKFFNASDELIPAPGGIAEWTTGARESEGVYYITGILDTARTSVYAKWYTSTDENEVWHAETLTIKQRSTSDMSTAQTNPEYVINISNMKAEYSRSEVGRFRLYTRLKDWSPTIYTVANNTIETTTIEQSYYKIFRVVDDETVIDYGRDTATTSNDHTKLSYDASGSYFDLDMSQLEAGYMYGIKLLFVINGEVKEQPEVFKFRVEK